MMRAEISGKNSVKGYQMKSDYEKERFNRGCIDYRKKILFLRNEPCNLMDFVISQSGETRDELH